MVNLIITCILLQAVIIRTSTVKYSPMKFEITHNYVSVSMQNCGDCFIEKKDVILVVGNWTLITCVKNLLQSETNIISLLGIDKRDKLSDYTSKTKLYKINPDSKPFPTKNVIIVGIDVQLLKLMLYKYKYSMWWNRYAHFFIENVNTLNTCNYAYNVLKIVWEFDILSAVFICDSDNHVDIKTFNPFRNYASDVWTEEKIYVEDTIHPFVLYKIAKYVNDLPLKCQDLFFVKTDQIGRYPVLIAGREAFETPYDRREKSEYKIRGYAGIMFQLILTKLNATPKLDIVTSKESPFIDDNGEAYGIYKLFFQNRYDVLLAPTITHDIWENKIFTNIQTNLCYITKKKLISLGDHVYSILSQPFFLSFGFSTLICAITIAYLGRLNFIALLLEVIRLTVGYAVVYPLNSRKIRLIFSFAIWIFTFTNFYFQNLLTSLMTASSYDPFIETMEDMVKYRYVVCGHISKKYLFEDTPLIKTFISNDKFDYCLNSLDRVKKLAVVITNFRAKFNVTESKDTHIALNTDYTTYYVHLLRDDYHLQKRITSIYNKLHEAGFNEYIHNNNYKFNVTSDEDKGLGVEIVTLSSLIFIFYFLLLGLALSGVIFVIELLYKKCIN